MGVPTSKGKEGSEGKGGALLIRRGTGGEGRERRGLLLSGTDGSEGERDGKGGKGNPQKSRD